MGKKVYFGNSIWEKHLLFMALNSEAFSLSIRVMLQFFLRLQLNLFISYWEL